MDAAAGFRLGNALHPVHAALVFQAGKRILARNEHDDLLHAPKLGHVRGERLHLHAMPLGIAGIHAQQIRAEKRSLIAARARADLQDDVFAVVRVFGDEQEFQLLFGFLHLLFQSGNLLLRHLAQLRIIRGFEHLPQLGQLCLHGKIRLVGRDDLLQIGVFFHQLAPKFLVGDHLAFGDLRRKLFISFSNGFQFFKHRFYSQAGPFSAKTIRSSPA